MPVSIHFTTTAFAARHMRTCGLVLLIACSTALAAPVADLAALDATVRLSSDQATPGAVNGGWFAPVQFAPGKAPRITLAPAQGNWNWSDARSLKIHVQNGMAWPVTLDVGLQDSEGGQLITRVALPPGPPQTLTIPLAPTQPKAWGMVAPPPMPWVRNDERVLIATQVGGKLARDKVASIAFSIPGPDATQTLLFGKVFTETVRDDLRETYSGIVDGFGQYTRGDWPEKVSSLQDLRARGAAEDQTLARWQSERKTADRYGGIPGAPGAKLKASGFFRTERRKQADGSERWWLVTPEGNRFFSLGINVLRAIGSDSFVEGREFMFTDLPKAGDALASFYGQRDSRAVLDANSGAQRGRGFGAGRGFDFYRANLQRRDGAADYAARWVTRTVQRLQAWGFNSVGNWSDVRSLGSQLPYTMPVHIEGDFVRISDGNDWWGAIPDAFDPRFARAAESAISKAVQGRSRDPMLIGYFVDNELAWGNGAATDARVRYALAYSVLRQDARAPESHAKRAFLALLKSRHADAGALADAWGLAQRQWTSLEPPLTAPLPDDRHPAIARDLSAFLSLHAETYFRTVADALKRADGNHLYLGSRFSSRTPEAVAACAKWCDVVSFNLYVPDIATGFEGEAFHALGKPAMLTEFHFGSSDRGPFWAGVQQVANEEARGPAYAKLLASVRANPDFVGAHWFQYLDEPVTGRWLDGENGHLGLVGITDLPWQGFVEAVRRSNLETLRSLQALR